MKVFKFGGASVRDAASVINVKNIVQQYGTAELVIVISAMGKTTNALEDVLNLRWNKQDFVPRLNDVKQFHINIMHELFGQQKLMVFNEVVAFFEDAIYALENYQGKNYDELYDQFIGFGELISTKIVSAYLSISGYEHIWMDARKLIFTDDLYREARVNFTETNKRIKAEIEPVIKTQAVVTQGFIGSCSSSKYTTLGREGSDYTAAIIAAALNAEELVIWKDVPGILNADPHKFANTVKFDFLTYNDAVEMTYYGASVLHPKTIKPIENSKIPLNVRSFINPAEAGTVICEKMPGGKTNVPVIILKENQALFHISTKNLEFVAEENIRRIFEQVVRHGIKVNTMSNSAISFDICIDDRGYKTAEFVRSLEADFTVTYKEKLQLLTVKNCTEQLLVKLIGDKKILQELRSHKTAQFVVAGGF